MLSQSYSSLGIVSYNDSIFENCYASMYEYQPDSLMIFLSPINKEKNPYAVSPFDLYFSVSKNDILKSPDPLYLENKDMNLFFFEKFPDWHIAEHSYNSKDGKIYLQKWENNYFSVSGNISLDNKENYMVQFFYYGTIDLVPQEVSFIQALNINDPEESEGKLFVEDREINIPFTFLIGEKDSIKVFFMDRFLYEDRNLEYAVSFQLNRNSLPIEKNITYNFSQTDRNMNAAFFDNGKNRIPEEAILKINKPNKNGIYKIEYSMRLVDERIIKGKYKGKLTFLFPE